MMRKNEITALENIENQDYSLGYEETKSLISKGLIRVLIDGKAQNDAFKSKIEAIENNNDVEEKSTIDE